MKIILAGSLILFQVQVYAQLLDKLLITIDTSSGGFESFVNELEDKYPVKVFYRKEWIDQIRVEKGYSQTLLPDVLRDVLKNSGLSYMSYRSNIVLVPEYSLLLINNGKQLNGIESATGQVISVGNPVNKGRYKVAEISGTIKNYKDDLPIPGAEVMIEGLNQGALTDDLGHYSIQLPVGRHSLKYSYIGLEEQVVRIDLIEDGVLDIHLNEEAIPLEEVTIYAESPDRNISSAGMSILKINSKEINKLPALAGEPDVIKSITLLPGVQTVGENASGFNVRGGKTDQNLILLDGASMYNTSHLFGMLSMINTSAIENVVLYKGGIPATYGGRISSVMDIQVKDGNKEKVHGEGSIGPVFSKLSFEGPMIRNICTFNAGGRFSYTDWILKMLPDINLRNSRSIFYDFYGKLDFNLTQKDRISVFAYYSFDRFRFGTSSVYQYGNLLGSVKYGHIFNAKLSSSFLVAYSDYNLDVTDDAIDYLSSVFNTGVSQRSVRVEFFYTPQYRHKINFGIEGIQYQFRPGQRRPYHPESMIVPKILENEQSFESTAFVSYQYEIGPRIILSAGLRYSAFFNYGPGVIHQYEDGLPFSHFTLTDSIQYGKNEVIQRYMGLEPRFSLRYRLGDNTSLKVSYNKTRQYLQMISNTAIISPTDFWKSCDPYIEPLLADQVALGVFRNFMGNRVEMSCELYYKQIQNVIDYKNGTVIVLNDFLENDLMSGSGKAYGLEILVRKTSGRLTGWASYTFSRSLIRMDSDNDDEVINGGNHYPSNYDKPHDVTLVGNFQLSRSWRLAADFNYSTGRPVTFPEIKYQLERSEIVYYSDRNKYRLPAYHRLNVSVSYDGNLKRNKKFNTSWTFSVYNVYGRKNVFSVFYNKELPSLDNDFTRFGLYKLSIIARPIPTLTFNFNF
ncbi:MAG: hypothetical protein AMS26_10380 [Bacteroides sp. SM23_62]|nr:MAG: hypothetical protein AMS26_10380 [Bacteroides sp. SM23_62]